MDADTIGKKSGKIIPVVIIMTLGLPLVNMMRGKKKMKIECPYCGSEEYEVYNICGGGKNLEELCVCLDCDGQFSIIYVVDCIEKES